MTRVRYEWNHLQHVNFPFMRDLIINIAFSFSKYSFERGNKKSQRFIILYRNQCSQCTLLLLIVSVSDTFIPFQTYIMTWRNARRLLDDTRVRTITLNNRHYFDDPSDQEMIGKGLRNMVQNIRYTRGHTGLQM